MKFNPGDTVRLTGKFLRNTGQFKGSEGQSKWKIVDCTNPLCNHSVYVAVNQATSTDYFTTEELAAQPCLKWRRVHINNLEIVKVKGAK